MRDSPRGEARRAPRRDLLRRAQPAPLQPRSPDGAAAPARRRARGADGGGGGRADDDHPAGGAGDPGGQRPARLQRRAQPRWGRAGGSLSQHLHQHVVPRWSGDANFITVLGGTKTLPQLLADTRALLAEALVAHHLITSRQTLVPAARREEIGRTGGAAGAPPRRKRCAVMYARSTSIQGDPATHRPGHQLCARGGHAGRDRHGRLHRSVDAGQPRDRPAASATTSWMSAGRDAGDRRTGLSAPQPRRRDHGRRRLEVHGVGDRGHAPRARGAGGIAGAVSPG